jgi:hypothetical protein
VRPIFVVHVRAEPGVDVIRSLRARLKVGLRGFGLRCISIGEAKQESKMDMRKFGSGFIKPDDVRDGPRRKKIINIHESDKYGCPVFEFEGGDQFSLNATNNRILCKAWGFESDNWLGLELELTLGTYQDWRSDPPEEKETVVVRAISARDPAHGNGEKLPAQVVSRSRDLDDEIPW